MQVERNSRSRTGLASCTRSDSQCRPTWGTGSTLYRRVVWPKAVSIITNHYVAFMLLCIAMRPVVPDVPSTVCVGVGHTGESCKNGWTDRDAVWDMNSWGSKKQRIRWGPRSPKGKGVFWRGAYLRLYRLGHHRLVHSTYSRLVGWLGFNGAFNTN